MQCPEADTLARLLRGDAPAAMVEQLQAHLADCAQCFARVAVAAAGMSSGAASGQFDTASAGWPVPDNRPLSPIFRDVSRRPDESLPVRVGAYLIERELGRGGMGVVYVARHAESGQRVALKTVTVPRSTFLESLRQEILSLASTRHPGIVRVLDYDVTSGDPWYAMELLEGETLADRNQELWQPVSGALLLPRGPADSITPPLPVVSKRRLEEILTLYRRLCDPLDFVHRAGIVHCDLKPANVFLRHGREPVLMDFGLVVQARGAIGREALSLASVRRGTLPYMSPEIIRGQIPDARADLYSLGCMLYESLVGRPPFVSTDRRKLSEHHLLSDVVPPSALVQGIPRALDDLVLKLLAKDVRDRVGQMQDVASALQRLGAVSDAPQLKPRIHLHRPTLVGRDGSEKQAAECIERALAGRGSLLLLHGQSGIGKTFLASEISQRAVLRGLRVITGECEAPTAAAPNGGAVAGNALHPFARFLHAVRDDCRREGAPAVERLLGDAGTVLAPYSPALASLPELQGAAPPPLPDAAGRERVLAALRQTLAAFAKERPLLLILDDLQWGDEMSLGLVEGLESDFLDGVPIVFIATFRTDEAGPALARIAEKPFVRVLPLAPLSRSDVDEMVGQMLGVSPVPELLGEFVYAQSEGVPFFVAEYLRAALSDKLLSSSSSGWSFSVGEDAVQATLGALPFPARLVDLVRHRLQGLQSARSLLEAAAVIGRDFELSVLARLTGRAVSEVRVGLSDALNRLIVEAREGDRYRFAHDKFREVIYSDLANERRVELHAKAANAIELEYRDQPALLAERLFAIARHYKLGGVPTNALGYFVKAGDRALGISADAEALAAFREAIEIEATLAQRVSALERAGWERRVADALIALGRTTESLTHLVNAAVILQRPFTLRVPGLLARLTLELGRRLLARLLPFELKRTSSKRREELLEAGRVFERLHRTSYYSGNALGLMVGCVSSLNICEAMASGPELSMAYANAGAICGVLRAQRWAENYFRKANDWYGKAPDPVVETLLRMVQGVYYMGVGRFALAAQHIESGLAVTDLIGFHRRREECLAVRAGIEIFGGYWSRASEWTLPLASSAKARGDRQMLSWSLLQQAECAIIRGDIATARERVDEAMPLLRHVAPPERLWAIALSALVAARAGNLELALEQAEAGTALLQQVPPVYIFCVYAYDRLMECWLLQIAQRNRRGTPIPASWRRALGRVASSLQSAAATFPVAEPLFCLQHGRLARERGRKSRAIRLFRRGLERARSLGMVYTEACITDELSVELPEASNERAELATRLGQALVSLDLPIDSVRSSVPPRPAQLPT